MCCRISLLNFFNKFHHLLPLSAVLPPANDQSNAPRMPPIVVPIIGINQPAVPPATVAAALAMFLNNCAPDILPLKILSTSTEDNTTTETIPL